MTYRRTKWNDPKVQKRIIDAVRAGNYLKTAAKLAGVSADTLHEWISKGRAGGEGVDPGLVEFVERIELAQAEWEEEAVKVVQQTAQSGAPNTWQAAMTMLERKAPDRWGKRDKVEIEADKPLLQFNQLVLSDPEAPESRELLRFVARLQARRSADARALEGPQTKSSKPATGRRQRMTLFETQSGRGVDINLPHTEWEELERVRVALEDLKKERRVTATRLSSLSGERERAISKDRDALAQAIREGKSDPGDKSVEKVEKEIQACNRRIEALDVALEDTERDLIAVVDEHREEWAPEVEGALEGARQEYGEAIEALARAYAKVTSTYALLRWVKLFPEQEMSYRVRGMKVNALRGQHGDPYLFDEVLGAPFGCLRGAGAHGRATRHGDAGNPRGAAQERARGARVLHGPRACTSEGEPGRVLPRRWGEEDRAAEDRWVRSLTQKTGHELMNEALRRVALRQSRRRRIGKADGGAGRTRLP